MITSNESAVRVASAAARALRRRSFAERQRRAVAKASAEPQAWANRVDVPLAQIIKDAANVRAKAARLAQEKP